MSTINVKIKMKIKMKIKTKILILYVHPHPNLDPELDRHFDHHLDLRLDLHVDLRLHLRPMRMRMQVNIKGDDGHGIELDGFGCAFATALVPGSAVACLRAVCATFALSLRVWSVARLPRQACCLSFLS